MGRGSLIHNDYEMPERADPIEEASNWIAMLDRGMDDQEEVSLREWLAAAPGNLTALMEVAKLWDRMDALFRLADLFPQSVTERQPRPAKLALALATTAVIAVLAGYWSTVVQRTADSSPVPIVAEAEKEQMFQTAIGEHSTVTLPDGSQVTLNTNSLIRARSTNGRRLLLLERGEAYVRVAHDPSRPLRVWVGDRFVEAIGTAFNVAITADQRVELIVTEGRVLVGVASKTLAHSPKVSSKSVAIEHSVPVSAGERMVLNDDGGAVEPIQPEELEVRLSWRGGNIIFRGESLSEALGEIERYTRVEFVILDEDLKKKRIVGMFKAGDVDGLLATLRQNFDIAFQRISDEKVILTNKSTQ